ncbi:MULTISPECIES: hypothetical protein [Microbacterium]|uniref:hypothetical protein n=1 Tax=Microbacterium TaxID=33882 RepID=UPI0012FE9356|nr:MULTISPECIES: hypothetical protein [Microbacterium]
MSTMKLRANLTRLGHDERGEVEPLLLLSGMAVGIVLAGILILQIPAWIKSAKTDAPDPTATATATPAGPGVAAAPLDLTVVWLTLTVVAGIAVLILIGSKVVPAIAAARRRSAYAAEARSRQLDAWQLFVDRHNELLRKIVHAETDWDTLFFTPAINDPSVPETLRMLQAMRIASNLRDTAGILPADLPIEADVTTLPYPQAVEAFDLAWDVAERNARRIGQAATPPRERKMISEIRTLLNIAENAAASATERALAYRKAQLLIGELTTIHVPKTALAQLEARVAPALEMMR